MLKKTVAAVMALIFLGTPAFAAHTFKITNRTGKDICGFHVAPKGGAWSDNLMTGRGCLKNGYVAEYYGPASSASVHDMRIVFADGTDALMEGVVQQHADGVTTVIDLDQY